ncbi:phosphoenolpyruvate--protein phosphotransferase [Melghiribacillus thermohalophilus]|uniref:Phosphoenolpyruvate-protein phosphotransferase n=1 Tax=Melghiribacillus thermohalophilus TaxID=1324956 RepID=A0A4R3MQZ1_9BACI|nr:phosphoenolpyruvate--protein phosphotransferase [Melghiribacillus thermohalophilus]TCT17570.1 phosphoenolpyruvate--protein phosphotransferase [Melghiribacillus thermohalophilus]
MKRQGISVSDGIAIGEALVITGQEPDIQKDMQGSVQKEVQSFETALENSRKEIQNIRNQSAADIGEEQAKIFDAHLSILEDPEIVDGVKEMIASEEVSAAYALDRKVTELLQLFETIDNEYLKERAQDLKDVGRRVIRHLLGVKDEILTDMKEGTILVAHDLAPSYTAQVDRRKVRGIITATGGRTSHAAIMARALGIPAVVGVKDIIKHIQPGETIGLDGFTGEVFLKLDNDQFQMLREKQQKNQARQDKLKKFIGKKTMTKDGLVRELAANIAAPEEAELALENDAEGIGLFRTEFLYMNRTELPDEEEQFEAYKAVLEKMGDRPVIIRTLDIGGDKNVTYLDFPEELNPFLGFRAIRYCLEHPELFKVQLRALLRASTYGNLKIMYPMVSNLEEVRAANALLEEAKQELSSESISFSSNIESGIMIETPAAAIISDQLAKNVDFFSIGTNDLIQYTMAADRLNEHVAHLYDPFHPGVLRLIKKVIDAAHQEGIWVGMCGELAGEEHLIPLFLGMGLDEFSMNPGNILQSREIISKWSMSEARELVQEVLNLTSSSEVKKRLDFFK